MEIRHTKPADMDAVLALYDAARCFMAENGNPDQWVNGYPGADQLSLDMASGGAMSAWTEAPSSAPSTLPWATSQTITGLTVAVGSTTGPMALSIASLQHLNPGSCQFLLGMVLWLNAVISALYPPE